MAWLAKELTLLEFSEECFIRLANAGGGAERHGVRVDMIDFEEGATIVSWALQRSAVSALTSENPQAHRSHSSETRALVCAPIGEVVRPTPLWVFVGHGRIVPA